MSLGKKWQTSEDNLKSYISLKLNSILQKISYKNDLKIDWITHDEDISLTQKQYELGVELKDKFKITNNLSLNTKAYRNFPLLEKTNTGLSSLSSGFNIGITYDLNPSPFNQENTNQILMIKIINLFRFTSKPILQLPKEYLTFQKMIMMVN